MSDDLSSKVPFVSRARSTEEAALESPATAPADRAIDNRAFVPPEAIEKFSRRLRRTGDLEVVLGKNNLLPASFLALGARRARAVCKVIVKDGVDFLGRPGSWSGTGFLVAPGVLLTNNHVLHSAEVAGKAVAQFDFEFDEDGKDKPTRSFSLAPTKLFVTSSARGGLDFTFVAIDEKASEIYGVVPTERDAFGVVMGDNLNIIQHPAGRRKEVTVQDNTVKNENAVTVRYTTDTEPGSSGSPVFNNAWKLVGLHHASKADDQGEPTASGDGPFLNEAIKLPAIAIELERLREDPTFGRSARDALAIFGGGDEALGFFGALGRETSGAAGPFEAVVDTYHGDDQDLDIGFWNIEWFNKTWRDKVGAVAEVIVKLGLDIWAFEETSKEATLALVAALRDDYGLDFAADFSEPDAPTTKQTTTVMWNRRTVQGEKRPWPDEVDTWLKDNSQSPREDFEAVHGKIFDRYPAWYRFTATSGARTFELNLVPLHLKAMAEGSLRRNLAAKYLAAIVRRMIDTGEATQDWILGGDCNAPLAQGDFEPLTGAGLVAISQDDEDGGAFSYVKGPRSLIDHIFLSPNLARTFGNGDYFIVALDRTVEQYTERLSDHRPALVRLSFGGLGATPESARLERALPDWLAKRVSPR